MAGGGYPAAYRAASRPLRMPSLPPLSSAANTARVPGSFPNLTPANQNAARNFASGAARALPIAGRLLPLIGYGLLLYEFWKLYQDFLAFQEKLGLASGWEEHHRCAGKREDFFNYSFQADAACRLAQAQQVRTDFTGRTQVESWQDNGPHFFGDPWRNADNAAGYRRVSGTAPWRNPNETRTTVVPIPDAPLPLPALIPQVLPEAAPPPGTAVPDPVPVPWAFVPWLPTESPTRAPIRGPSRPVRPRPNPYRYPKERTRPKFPTKPGEKPDWQTRPRRKPPRGPHPTRPPMTEPRRPPIYIPFPEVPPLEEEETGALPGPDTTPAPGMAPELVPSSRVELRPGFKPRVSRTPHRRQKPGRRTRERKVILSWGNHLVFARGINSATEFCDFVDALYQSLSQERRDKIEAERPKVPDWFYRSKGMNLPCHEKAWAVFWYLQDADLNEAIKNLITNQIVDFVFGKAGKAAGSVGRAIGSPTGLATGPAI